MMDHADIRTFLKHYLPRRITVDTAAIFRGIDPQESIMRSACTMSRWIDPDRPWELTEKQALSVNDNPAIVSLLEKRSQLKQRLVSRATKHPGYQKIDKMVRSEKQRLRRELLLDVQEKYEREGPVREIELQLSGIKISETPKFLPYFSEDSLPEQKRLIESLMLMPPGSTYDEEVQRRNCAISAVTTYCKVEEGPTPRSRNSRPAAVKQETEALSQQDRALEAAMLSVLKVKRPTICFLCLGNTSAPLEQRIQSFSTPGNLSVHFKRKHLAVVGDGDLIDCKVCEMQLNNKMHLQSHAHKVHGTVS
jgi:Protein of unknown function (DUF3435)